MDGYGLSSPWIFVCYRPSDAGAGACARWLKDRMRERIPDANVHTSGERLWSSTTTVKDMRKAFGRYSVMVVLIGPQWATAVDRAGHPRLDNPDDEERIAIQTAFERDVPVILVLIGDATPPRQQELPSELHKLARLNAVVLSESRYEPDGDRLIDFIRRRLGGGWDVGQLTAADVVEAAAKDVDPAAATGPVTPPKRTRWFPRRKIRPKVFLCYRREDAQGFAGRVYDSLVGKYGHERVFRDIDSIPAGVRFPIWIESRVTQCSVMIVLIGAAWLSVKDDTGQRRLDSPKDWVRQEIEAALRRDIPIIPVRVDGAPIPSQGELPASIADLAEYESAEVSDRRWAYDMGQLIQAIDNLSSSE